jgi:hypothetical protein
MKGRIVSPIPIVVRVLVYGVLMILAFTLFISVIPLGTSVSTHSAMAQVETPSPTPELIPTATPTLDPASTNTPVPISTATPTPTSRPIFTPTPSSTPTLLQQLSGFHVHYACRKDSDGTLKDTNVVVWGGSTATCPNNWTLIQIAVKDVH